MRDKTLLKWVDAMYQRLIGPKTIFHNVFRNRDQGNFSNAIVSQMPASAYGLQPRPFLTNMAINEHVLGMGL